MTTTKEGIQVGFRPLEDAMVRYVTYTALDSTSEPKGRFGYDLAISDAGMSSVTEVIELAMNAKSLWKEMNRQERLEYLKRVCSNQTLEGLTVSYQLEKPFARLAAWKENGGWRREWDSNPRYLLQ